MKIKILLVLAIAAVALFGWKVMRDQSASKEQTPAVEQQKSDKSVEKGVSKASGKKVSRKGRKLRKRRAQAADGEQVEGKERKKVRPEVKIDDEEKDFTEEERQISAELQNAVNNENVKDVITLGIAAASSKNAEIRRRAVDALGWFGKKTMAEMTLFMNDSDEDVASEALDQWEHAMFEVSAGAEKATLIELGMKTVRDPDALESMIMEVGELSNALAMQTMVNVIETGNPEAQKVAKEHYEFFTGDEYTNRQAAEQWLAENPDDE